MQEIPVHMDQEITQNNDKMELCDLICFCYDASDPNSFAYVAELRVGATV